LLKVSSSSPARAFGGEDLSRLLAQPAPWSKPASSARCRGDPWDVSRQVALPLAYPVSHPHDTQRAKVKHVQESGNNTKYFHIIANGKHRRKKKVQLEQDEGTIMGEENLKVYITKF
jgi:hypothetical protein